MQGLVTEASEEWFFGCNLHQQLLYLYLKPAVDRPLQKVHSTLGAAVLVCTSNHQTGSGGTTAAFTAAAIDTHFAVDIRMLRYYYPAAMTIMLQLRGQ